MCAYVRVHVSRSRGVSKTNKRSRTNKRSTKHQQEELCTNKRPHKRHLVSTQDESRAGVQGIWHTLKSYTWHTLKSYTKGMCHPSCHHTHTTGRPVSNMRAVKQALAWLTKRSSQFASNQVLESLCFKASAPVTEGCANRVTQALDVHGGGLAG